MKRIYLTNVLKLVVPSILLAALAIPVAAQTARSGRVPVAEVETGIMAHGHAEIKGKPDIAMAAIGVTTEAKDQTTAARDNAKRTRQVMAALKSAGIADKDIETLAYSVQPQYDYNVHPPLLTGYQVTNSIQIKIRDLAKAGVILDEATQAEASEVSALTFDVEDHHKLEDMALSAAIANARGKANLMAAAAGVGVGRLVNLTEGIAPAIQPIYSGAVMRASAMAEAPPTPISPREITVTADVTLIYAIDYAP